MCLFLCITLLLQPLKLLEREQLAKKKQMRLTPGVIAQGHGGWGMAAAWELWSLRSFTDLGRGMLQGQVYQAPLPQLVAVAALRGCQQVPALSCCSRC